MNRQIILNGGARTATERSKLVRAAIDMRLGFSVRDHLAGPDAEATDANIVFGDYYQLASQYDGHPILTPNDEARLAGLGRTLKQVAALRRLIRHNEGRNVLSRNHLRFQLEAIGFEYRSSTAEDDRLSMLTGWRDAHYRAPHLHDDAVQRSGDPLTFLLEHGHLVTGPCATVPKAMAAQREQVAEPQQELPDERPTNTVEPRLSQVVDDVVSDIIAQGRWSPGKGGTGEDGLRFIKQFGWMAGDLGVSKYDQTHWAWFVRELRKMPKSVRVQSIWDRPYAEAKHDFPALTPANTRSQITINKDLSYASTFNEAMIAAGYWIKGRINPLLLSNRVTKAQKRGARPPWTMPHIEAMFSSPIYRGNGGPKRRLKTGTAYPHDAAYWVLPLAWFMFARREELCGILVDDIVVNESAVPHIILRPNSLRGLKSEAAIRVIPLHPRLIGLGFLEFVSAVRATGDSLLFPELWLYDGKRGGDQYYALVWSKLMDWLRQQPDLNIPTGTCGKTADFHSIRATGLSQLDRADINQNIVADLAGHSRTGVTAVSYQNLLASGGLDEVLAERLAVLMRLPDPTSGVIGTSVSLLPLNLRSR